MFTISLCMIIKNEQEVLDRVLSCAKKFADEIIIVDTGSTDKSVAIAKKYTDKIFYFKWNDNFSDARNFSFSKATKDYIMWLDADDYITDSEIDKINSLKLSTNTPSMFLFKYAVSFENDKPTFEFFRERLLKRTFNFKWQGFIHETNPLSRDAMYLDITIEHRKIKQGNPKRNLIIYRKAKRNGVTFTPRDTYYYARELYYNGYYKSSIKELNKFLNCKEIYPPNAIEARLLLSKMYIFFNDLSMAKKHLIKCLEDYSPTPPICCSLGEIFVLENNITTAIAWYNLALSAEDLIGGFVERDYKNFIPHLQLSVLNYKSNNMTLAKHHHNEAKKLKPQHPSIIFNDKFFK